MRASCPTLPLVRILFITTLSAIVVFLGLCKFLRISHRNDVLAYCGMHRECHPAWKQFALRRFGAGDSTKKLLRRFPPTRTEEFGRYGIYSYGDGFTVFWVMTKDDKLLSAAVGSCTWQFTFFHTPDPELERQYAALLNARAVKSSSQELNRLQGELLRFYFQNDRWPSNKTEFGCFVTGEQPPIEQTKLDLTRQEAAFRKRFGLDIPNTVPYNPLGISLHEETNGSICIALQRESPVAAIVSKPGRNEAP
jgi:hypothetical protein